MTVRREAGGSCRTARAIAIPRSRPASDPARMCAVLAVLTMATAWFGDGLIRRARTLGRYIGWASATLLWLAGAYIVYYWLTAIRLS